MAEVTSRIGLLGVVDVQRHVTRGHARGEPNSALKLGTPHTDGAFRVRDYLSKKREANIVYRVLFLNDLVKVRNVL